jgi:hypothetical protein
MSHIFCLVNFTNSTITFDTNNLAHHGTAFQMGIEDRQSFVDLRFEITIGEETKYKPDGSYKYGQSDQEFVDYIYFDLLPNTEYTANFFVRDGQEEVTESLTFTTPKPPQPYPSWTWEDYDWNPPVPYPEDDTMLYIWDEEGQQWTPAPVQ